MLADNRHSVIEYLSTMIEENKGIQYHLVLTFRLKKDGAEG